MSSHNFFDAGCHIAVYLVTYSDIILLQSNYPRGISSSRCPLLVNVRALFPETIYFVVLSARFSTKL